MRLMRPDPAAALLGLRAMKTIASAARPDRPGPARALMEAAQKVILHVDADIDTLPPVTPAELAAGFPGAELRQQFANGMLVMAVADGVPARETLAQVEALRRGPGDRLAGAGRPQAAGDGYAALQARLPAARPHRRHHEERAQDTGACFGFAKSVLRHARPDGGSGAGSALPRLGKLPEGTLGRSLIDFYNQHGFSVPGERGGFPEAGLYHDFCHLLGGYSTEPDGEVEVASFTAGYKRERPFYVALFAGADLQHRRQHAADARTAS